MPPPKFFSLTGPAEGLLDDNYPTAGTWSVWTDVSTSASEPVAIQPFLSSTTGVGIDLYWRGDEYKKGLKASATIKPSTLLTEFSPEIQFEDGDVTYKLKPRDLSATYQFVHPTFTGSLEVGRDGFGILTEGKGTVALTDHCTGGLSFAYDPFRSGLKKYKIALLCESATDRGSFGAVYDANRNHQVFGIVKSGCHRAAAGVRFSCENIAEIGLQKTSPCGAVAQMKLNVKARTLGVSIQRQLSDWKFTLAAEFGRNDEMWKPSFGFKLSQ